MVNKNLFYCVARKRKVSNTGDDRNRARCDVDGLHKACFYQCGEQCGELWWGQAGLTVGRGPSKTQLEVPGLNADSLHVIKNSLS